MVVGKKNVESFFILMVLDKYFSSYFPLEINLGNKLNFRIFTVVMMVFGIMNLALECFVGEII